ncbi:MAG TPA: vancomycin resistance histidine kinase VanS [Mobilitalea sp.]|nr:vancomycin resistance histidine kinase VanS [Mobilitalea sp.]
MNNRKVNLKRALSFRILYRFFIAIMIYTIIMITSFFIAKQFLGQFIWYKQDFLYQFFNLIDDNYIEFFIVICGTGYLIIFLYYWMKTLGYLENIIKATEVMYNTKDELIELPLELKEVEYQMNQIKLDIQSNERAAKEAEQRKNDLVVYLAHDLKTPLTSVIGYLTLLRDENQISEELREKYLSISLEKAERLEELINEFFEITRFNLANLTLELSKINLTRMLEQITYEFKPMLAEKSLSCVINAEPNIMIKYDVNKMQRVFDNLIRNAINYSFPGETITISAMQTDTGVKLSFLNHGNTIPSEKLERIFEQFYRLDTARTSNTGGAGLGLAIAKEIVELHKGKITAQSANDVIEFIITLPNPS